MHNDFYNITWFFIGGSGVGLGFASTADYIYCAHHAFTYYTAVKYDLFRNLPQLNRGIELFSTTSTPSNPNANELLKLKTFAQFEDNAKKLGWDVNDILTWQGVQWTEGIENRIASIDISYTDVIGELDVSGFSELTTLDVSGNLLSGLDVTGCLMLSTLDCSHNLLTELTVDNADIIECSFNNLTSLDVSNAVTLTKLYCNANQMTELDVSANILLIDLDCSSNDLTSVNFTSNTELTTLRCSYNYLDLQIGSYLRNQIDIIDERETSLVRSLPQKD